MPSSTPTPPERQPEPEGSLDSSAQPTRRTPKEWLSYAWNHWASRSLLLGALATCLDLCVLEACVRGFGLPNPAGAMVGVLFGATFTFFANRHFAFQDHHPELAPQAVKFALATSLCMVIHAYLVHIFADNLGVPVEFAKLGADLLVFSVGQLLVLRFLVFPTAKTSPQLVAENMKPELEGITLETPVLLPEQYPN